MKLKKFLKRYTIVTDPTVNTDRGMSIGRSVRDAFIVRYNLSYVDNIEVYDDNSVYLYYGVHHVATSDVKSVMDSLTVGRIIPEYPPTYHG